MSLRLTDRRVCSFAGVVALLVNVLVGTLVMTGIGATFATKAQAAVTCNSSSTAVNATYNGNALSNTVTLYPKCAGANPATTFQICINGSLVPGSGGTTISPFRQLDDGNGNKANWQLYTTDGTAITQIYTFITTLTGDQLNNGSGSVKIALGYPVQSAGYGTFTTVADIAVNIKYGSECASGQSTSIDYTLNYSVTVPPSCSAITTSNVSFGNITTTSATAITALGTISVICTNNSPYTVYIGPGQNNDGSFNRMASGGSFIRYGLYKDSGNSQSWTSASGVAGTGNGATQSLSVYGQIPIQATPPVGTYADIVVVTLRY